jgi:hypothetical protein
MMKRILKRIGRWLGLIDRRWWDDLDCSPVIVIEGKMLAAALERLPAGIQPACKWPEKIPVPDVADEAVWG